MIKIHCSTKWNETKLWEHINKFKKNFFVEVHTSECRWQWNQLTYITSIVGMPGLKQELHKLSGIQCTAVACLNITHAGVIMIIHVSSLICLLQLIFKQGPCGDFAAPFPPSVSWLNVYQHTETNMWHSCMSVPSTDLEAYYHKLWLCMNLRCVSVDAVSFTCVSGYKTQSDHTRNTGDMLTNKGNKE